MTLDRGSMREVVGSRLARLRKGMAQRELDAFLSLKLVNTYYLSGLTSLDTARPTSYTRPIVVIVDESSACLIIPSLDEEAADETSAVRDIRSYSTSPAPEAARKLVAERLRELGAKRVGIEQDTVTHDWIRFLDRNAPGAELVEANRVIEELRTVKDEVEIAQLRIAAELSDAAVSAGLAASSSGVRELQAETEGLVALRQAASERGDGAFVDVISLILSGPKGAMPHEFTTGKRLEVGELMWHCWLVSYEGYWVENVRAGVVSPTPGDHEDTYELVRESLLAGQEAARPGALAGDVYRAVMGVLKSRPTPGRILTRSGHGMGLEYHEPPFIEDTDETPLEPGLVLTVEPGVWIGGVGGITLSNTLVIREDQAEVITQASLDFYKAR